MRRILIPLSLAWWPALAVCAWAAAPSPQASTSKSSTTKKKSTAQKSKSAPKSAPTAATKSPVASKAKRAPVVARHYAPQQPTPERYKEIQQALAEKGYFKNQPDGNWGPASIDALKRFQHDQKLAEDGKIGSLSLIALGLGPKREPAAETEPKLP